MKQELTYAGRRGRAGFTLVEQIMALAVAAVLACMAAPSLHAMLVRTQLRTAQMDYYSALQYARTSAILQQRRMLLCPSRDGRRCSDETDWTAGWLVGPDQDRDNQPDGAPLRVGQDHGRRIRVASTIGRRSMHFQPDGSAEGSNLTLLFCPSSGAAAQALSLKVSNAGRVRAAPAAPGDCASRPP